MLCLKEVHMKTLVIVRHGCYDGNGLTDEGKQQIVKLAKVLALRLNGHSVVLLSSTALRARQTTEILSEHLGGLVFDLYECLFSSGYLSKEGAGEAIRLVAEKGETHDIVILSTHLEYIEQFPTIWGKTQGLQVATEAYDIPKGSARVVDVQTGKAELLVP